jgi:hypothetical protein
MFGGDGLVNTLKLKGRIRELNLTQEDCAKALNIQTPTFSQKINNLRPFSLSQAEALAKFLHIPDDRFGVYFFYS